MRRRLIRAGVVFVIGFVMMLFGIANTALGIAGFLIMLVSLVLALSAWKRLGNPNAAMVRETRAETKGLLRSVDGPAKRQTGKKSKPPRQSKSGPTSGSAMERLEQRWKRRWDERGGPSY